MPSIYDLKPRFQNLLRPLCERLVRLGVSANQVTLFAALISLLFGLALYFSSGSTGLLVLLPLVLLIRMGLNAIDGMLAREFDQKSNLGAILNELTDVISDAALYLPFAIIPGFHPLLIILIVLLSTWSEMLGVVGIQIGASRRYDGPMGKSDRAFVFGLIGLLLGLGVSLDSWTLYIELLVIALLCLTLRNRANAALKEAA
jgi:CDP-diacylglycerol--glycerol-3-phosphate 3-phosphatidyltransferase